MTIHRTPGGDDTVKFVSEQIEKQFARRQSGVNVIDEVISTINQNKFVNGIKSSTGIDPSMRYCKKTGQPLGKFSDQILARLSQDERSMEVAKLTFCNEIAPDWYYTDGRNLQQQAKRDPLGFFVYACSEAIKNKQVGYNKIKNIWASREDEINYCRQKVELYHWLETNADMQFIIHANDAWALFLGQYNPNLNKVEFNFNHLNEFANHKIIIDLPEILAKTLREVLIKVADHHLINTKLRMLRAANKLEGFANFKQINRNRGETDVEYTMRVLTERGFMRDTDDEEVLTIINPRIEQLARKIKSKEHQQKVEKATAPATSLNIQTFKIKFGGQGS